jgi:hypothetical protein
MSMRKWARLVLMRYPRSRHAHNLALLADMFNISMRHEARLGLSLS